MFYTASPGIKRRELTKLVDDMAVTVQVYSYIFVLEYEETGRFRIGDDIRLTVCCL